MTASRSVSLLLGVLLRVLLVLGVLRVGLFLRVDVVVVEGGLLLVVQILVEWSRVRAGHGLHVGVQLTHVDIVPVAALVVVLLLVVITGVVVLP